MVLMLSMFVVFLTSTIECAKGKVTATESDTGTEAAQSSPRMPPTIVGGFEPEIGGITRAYLGVAGKPDACTRGNDDFGVFCRVTVTSRSAGVARG